MLISQDRAFASILWTLQKLQERKDVPKDVLYDAQGMAIMLRQAMHVQDSQGAGIHGYCEQTINLLIDMQTTGSVAQHHAVQKVFDGLIAEGKSIAASGLQGGALQEIFIGFLHQMDRQFSHIANTSPEVASPLFASFSEKLLALHNRFDLLGKKVTETVPEVAHSDALTLENLTAYMQETLSDATASVTGLTVLTGGFGKETSLFNVSSKNFTADLVMRRDPPNNFFEGIDCHAVKEEFPLLQALFEHGFQVPEAFWLETSPRIIKGPDYIIVRKAKGRVEGDATGGQGKVSSELQRELARVAASLHALPPIAELGTHNPAFRSSLWNESISSSVHHYIANYYKHNMKTGRIPVPALHGLFNWMLVHVPPCEDRPTLVHGDIGLHNLMFHEGKLSAVLDWEFAHIGDPAEDIGYIRAMMGNQLDWPVFLNEYAKAGGRIPDEKSVLFYEIWAHVRNASGSCIVTESFANGTFQNARYGLVPYHFVAHYLTRAQALIDDWEKLEAPNQFVY